MQNDASNFLPKTNRDVAEMLFAIEVGLRELIIEVLSEIGGAKWHKQLLPSDVSEKYLRGRRSQLAATWSNHVEHHPIYYVDFPDLAKVLNTNWKNIFHEMFGDKDVFLGSLKSLEPIRNSLAHNRKISETDAAQVSGIFAQFKSAFGRERFESLVENCTTVPSIREIMELLSCEIEHACEEIATLSAPTDPVVWRTVKDAWWFDDEYLTATNNKAKLNIAEEKLRELEKTVAATKSEIERLRQNQVRDGEPVTSRIVEPIAAFFSLHTEFASLTRGRGAGHQLESWLAGRSPRSLMHTATGAIQYIKDNCNE